MRCGSIKIVQSSVQELSFQGRVPATKTIARGDCSWYRDYLSPHLVYPPSCFREVFHLPLALYNKVHALLVANEPLIRMRTNAFGMQGHSSHQKILCAIRKLATGLSFKQLDDMARMSSESQRQYFELFLRSLKRNFGPQLLNRPPTLSELRSVAKKYEKEGFPGCIGCVDCMHLHWKNCPKALKGQYHNPKAGKLATISCEAMVDHDLYCWHWFPGRVGTNNDITVLQNSPLFIDILSGKRCMELPEGYILNGEHKQWLLYFLGDGIYPEWAILILPNHAPINDRELYVTKRQEATRKDVERFFGCLQGRFKILRQERHEWSDALVILISEGCVVLHNLIVRMYLAGEVEDTAVTEFYEQNNGNIEQDQMDIPLETTLEDEGGSVLNALLSQASLVSNRKRHIELTENLSHHLWKIRGNEN